MAPGGREQVRRQCPLEGNLVTVVLLADNSMWLVR